MATLSEVANHSRATTGTYIDADGNLQTAEINEPRVGHHLWDGSEWVNAGLLHESESRTNLLLNSASLGTQTVAVTPNEPHTISFYSGETVVDLDESIAATAVDVFVYDTSKDSDGGAWRTGALAQASSWYNETLNTATRGSRREFPAVAVIVAEATKVTIYDGDDPSLPMWMVFTGAYNNMLGLGSTYIFVSVAALNGKITPCSYDGAMGGLKIIDFAADKGNRVGASASSPTTGRYNGTISQRNAALGVSYVTGDYSNTIVSNFTNDVAMTVLPDAPIDPATGLPVPTIACLVAETEVTMADGSTKRLDQVVVGDVVKTLEGEHSVLNWWDQGIKDVIELEFDGGQKITCTSDHKIRTTEGWVEAGDLTDAHKVVGL